MEETELNKIMEKPIENMTPNELIVAQGELTKRLNQAIDSLDVVETAQDMIGKKLMEKGLEKANLLVAIKMLESEKENWETPVKKAKTNISKLRNSLRSVERFIFKK